MDAEPTNAEKICNLVVLLKRKEPLAWETVEEAVADYPGWQLYVETLRYRTPNAFGSLMLPTIVTDYPEDVPKDKQAALLYIFAPYAILLDPTLDNSMKIKRIERLVALETQAFWQNALDNLDLEIRTAAAELLAWKESRSSLLRGSDAPETDAEELLRAAKSTQTSAEHLLRSGEIPAVNSPKPVGFWTRLLRRR